MSDIALKVKGLGKRYRLGKEQPTGGGYFRYKSMGDTLASFARRPMQTFKTALAQQAMDDENSFWALQGVDFEVKKGEVVGIIGRNGAGKSTLLKVLSRITKPTIGRVDLFGRVGSLLEVGTGFHPELSGRENIYLNGAILGMTGGEVRSKFDDIVSFSETERFLDTPVKQYSSGMYMRLAFAVAAHLEPEILVIDEVLAVGDAAFQKKCLGKMNDEAKRGRTILFVSHNMAAVQQLCSRGVLMQGGQVLVDGPTNDAVRAYFASTDTSQDLSRRRPSGYAAWIKSASAAAADGGDAITPQSGVSFSAQFESPTDEAAAQPVMGVVIRDIMGDNVGAINTRITGFSSPAASAGTMRCTVRDLPLIPGRYTADLWFGDGSVDLDCVEEAVEFNVDFIDVYGSGQLAPSRFGPLVLEPEWKFQINEKL